MLAERLKKLGTQLQHWTVEGDMTVYVYKGKEGEISATLQTVSVCVYYTVCITAVLEMWLDRKDIKGHYKNT